MASTAEEEFVNLKRRILGSSSSKRMKKIFDKSGTCVGCTGVSPFAMTSEYDILTKNKSENILKASQIMCSALHANNKELISMRTDLKRSETVFKIDDIIKSYKHDEEPTLYDDDENDKPSSKMAEAKALARSFTSKVTILSHYACAIRSLHQMGYFHLNIDPQNLLVHYDHGQKKAKGFIYNFENATAFSKKHDTFVLSKISRGHPIFRPPEHHHLHFFEEKAAAAAAATQTVVNVGFVNKGIPRTSSEKHRKGGLFFKIDEKFDVWSLGMSFLHILTELPVFVIHPGRPHLSSKGAERIEALEERRDSSKDKIVNAIVTECVRWQTLRLFGSTGTVELPLTEADKNESDLKRKISISAMVGGAILKGLIPNDGIHPDLCIDLLFKMLNPNPADRISIQEVCIHPLFADNLATTTRTSAEAAAQIMISLPIDEWSREKDKAVVEMVRTFSSSKETSHLSVESVFVLFDMLVRIANGIEKEKVKTKLLFRNSLAAAAKVCFSLYDQTPEGYSLPFENDITRTLEPVVVEYLKGDLRRPEYLYDRLYTREQVETLLNLMSSYENDNAILFRENYGKLDMKKFIEELFGKGYHLSAERKIPTNLKIHHMAPDFLTSS